MIDTGGIKRQDNRREIASPKPCQPFCRQDAQFREGDLTRIYNYARLARGGLNN